MSTTEQKISQMTAATIVGGESIEMVQSGATRRGTIGSIAKQNSNAVTITGGTITGITDLAVADGGTGASTAAAAATNLGLGTTDSPQFAAIEVGAVSDTTLARLSAGDLSVEGNRIFRVGGADVPVADGGTGASTAAAAATNLGLGTTDSPQFLAVNIGAATDTTVARASAGDISVEGNLIYRAGGTDVPVTDGGTGSSTAAGARSNLGAIGGTTGATDNALLRADGTAGATVQTSGVVVSDANSVSGVVNLAQTGYTDLTEISAPATPAVNVARLYSRDDSGITRLFFKNSSGGQIPIEPNILPQDFGAVGDGTTDDTAAITAANAVTAAKFMPTGVYDTTISQSAIVGPYWGRGQIRDSADNLRGPWFSAISTQPTRGNQTSVLTAFNGNLSGVQIAMEHRVTGATTAGDPTTGYDIIAEICPIYMYHFTTSGKNAATASNDGRTGQMMQMLNFAHAGQGDMGAIYVNGISTNTRAGATSFLANPAIAILYGQLFAAATGTYLNIIELNGNDSGFQAAAIGIVLNFNRTIATATLGEVWMGLRPQSRGSTACDVIYSGAGTWKRGLDFTAVTFDANKSAINLKADDRIYGNSTSSGVAVTWGQTTGDDYFEFSSSLNAWHFIVDNTSQFQIYNNQVVSNQGIIVNGTASGFVGLLLASTNTDANGGPFFVLDRNSASPAAADNIGGLTFQGRDSGNNATAYAFISASILDPTNGSEDGQWTLSTQVAGALTQQLAVANGIQIGTPASGFLGTGTLNAAGLINSLASIRGHSSTAIPAGGTAGAGILLSSTTNFGIFFGSGAPTLSAAAGSLYIRTDNAGANLRLYSNTTGSTTWVAITSA
jgi:hypothetical protein